METTAIVLVQSSSYAYYAPQNSEWRVVDGRHNRLTVKIPCARFLIVERNAACHASLPALFSLSLALLNGSRVAAEGV